MNDENIISNKYYLDSNFLIAYLIKGHDLHKRARLKFIDLAEKNGLLFLSPLVIDETWYKTKYILEKKENIGEKSFKDYYDNFKDVMDLIEEKNFIKIVQLKENLLEGCLKALNIIKEYNLRPHDAFHLAIMRDNDIFNIVTLDSDFSKETNKTKLKENGFNVIEY